MPGLLGYIKKNDVISDNSLIDNMCKTLMHEKWYKTDKITEDHFAFARVHQNIFNPEQQPIYNNDKSLCVFMYGKIYDYENDLQRLEKKGYVFKYRNDPEYCLYLFEEHGVNFINELNGSFVIVIYSLKNNALYLFNDRYGSRPIYYHYGKDGITFACEVKAILKNGKIRKEICKTALANFFYYGHLIGDETFVEDINILPPASILFYGNNQIKIDEYWQLKYQQDDNRSEKEFVDLLVEKWKHAVTIRLEDNHKYGLSLSGGLDSRSILAAIPKKVIPSFITFTYGREESFIAKKAAKIIGTNNYTVEIDYDDAIKNFGEKVININDGMNRIATCVLLPAYEKMCDKIDVCFNGNPGDGSLGGGYLKTKLFRIKNDNEFIKYVKTKKENDKIFSKNEINKLLSISTEEFGNTIDKSLEDILDLNISSNPANRYDTLLMYYIRQRRFTMLGDDHIRSKFEEALPFYDNEFFDVISKIPPKWRIHHRIYRKFLLKLAPELSKIRYLNTGISVESPIYLWKLSILYQRIIRKLKGIILKKSRGLIGLKEKKKYVDVKNLLRSNENWQKFVKEKLDELPEDIFNKIYIDGLFEEHINLKKDNSNKLSILVSFSIFYNNYLTK